MAVSSPAILRFAAAATTPYASIERMTRLLIAADRWPNRSRPGFRPGDLASLTNALMGSVTDAVGTDNLLRALEYKCALPTTAEQAPALGEGRWGEVLERLIENAPQELFSGAPATNDADFRGVLPHIIEACLNPPSILLVWLAPDGATRERIEVYGPPRDMQSREPYGPASWLIRKSFMNSNMIVLAGQILRGSSPRYARSANETAASLPGEAAERKSPGPTKPTGNSNLPEAMRARESAQGESDPGPSPFTTETTNGYRRKSTADRSDAPAAAAL